MIGDCRNKALVCLNGCYIKEKKRAPSVVNILMVTSGPFIHLYVCTDQKFDEHEFYGVTTN
jgi:hypothetical protein